MLWFVVLPFFVTCIGLLVAIVLATVLAPRAGWRRGRAFSWALVLAFLAFVPSCSVLNTVIKAARLGTARYENVDAIWDRRFKRWLPESATEIVLHKHLQGYDARFQIDRKSLDSWFDDIWANARESARPRTEPSIDRDFEPQEFERRFGALADGHPKVGARWVLYQSPERSNWAGAKTWFDEESGVAYQDVGFW